MSGLSVNLTTLFLGKPPRDSLPVLSVHSFAINGWSLDVNCGKSENFIKSHKDLMHLTDFSALLIPFTCMCMC